jgi:hypothetical protein
MRMARAAPPRWSCSNDCMSSGACATPPHAQGGSNGLGLTRVAMATPRGAPLRLIAHACAMCISNSSMLQVATSGGCQQCLQSNQASVAGVVTSMPSLTDPGAKGKNTPFLHTGAKGKKQKHWAGRGPGQRMCLLTRAVRGRHECCHSQCPHQKPMRCMSSSQSNACPHHKPMHVLIANQCMSSSQKPMHVLIAKTNACPHHKPMRVLIPNQCTSSSQPHAFLLCTVSGRSRHHGVGCWPAGLTVWLGPPPSIMVGT